METLLRRCVPFKEIGWEEFEEKFTRFQLLKTPLFNLYLHKLEAPLLHHHCHDHPWDFWVFIVSGGYWEYLKGKKYWRNPFSIFFRPASTRHNVVTEGVNWSLVLTSNKKRDWRVIEEEGCQCE